MQANIIIVDSVKNRETNLEMDFLQIKRKKKIRNKSLRNKNPIKDENDEIRLAISSDHDYTYSELLKRITEQIIAENPKVIVGQKSKLILPQPQVFRVGAKKTAFINFLEIVRVIHRLPKHLFNYLLIELGTSGSINGNQELIIKGRFKQNQIENVLEHYIKEYVLCHTCSSPETMLLKNCRLYFLQCSICGSKYTVDNFKTGFKAVMDKNSRAM